MNRVSAVVIVQDEEANIGRCLASLGWADETVVVDSGSTDRTVDICREHGSKVVIKTDWEGYGPQKRFAVAQAANDWVFSVDADEEVSAALARSVRTVLAAPAHDGYRVRRNSYYLGRRIRHCGWNHDYPLRLFNRTRGGFNARIVHESVRLEGSAGVLQEPLLHYTYPTVESHYRKMERYAVMGATRMHARGRRTYPGEGVLRGGAKFLKMYLLQAGFLDGRTGALLSARSAYGVYLKYNELWRLKK